MSIGEIAKSLGITRRIILNYEEKNLLQADVKDGATGNRYYLADSLTKIRTIRVLQNLGLSLDDIQAYYDGTTDMEPMIERLEKLRDELNLNIEKLKQRVKSDNDFELHTVTIPEQTIYRRTMRADTVEQRKEHLRDIIPDAMRKYGSDTSKRMYFIEYPLEDPNLISYCIAVPPQSEGEYIHKLPEEKALCIFYHGSYESIPDIRDRLIAYAKEHGFSLKGTCRKRGVVMEPLHQGDILKIEKIFRVNPNINSFCVNNFPNYFICHLYSSTMFSICSNFCKAFIYAMSLLYCSSPMHHI